MTWEPVMSESHSQRWIDTDEDDENKPAPDEKYVDLPCDIPPVYHTKVRVICKKNSCNIRGLNKILQDWIEARFKYDIHHGWKSRTRDEIAKDNDPK